MFSYVISSYLLYAVRRNRGGVTSSMHSPPYLDKVQNLLYEDFRYLGTQAKKKYILTMLRVPGTLNSRNNMHVRIPHDSEKIPLSDLTNGLW